MISLYEQYRPSCWEEVAGQDKLVRGLSVLRRRGLVGRVFWLAGDSGTGKTTVGNDATRNSSSSHHWSKARCLTGGWESVSQELPASKLQRACPSARRLAKSKPYWLASYITLAHRTPRQ